MEEQNFLSYYKGTKQNLAGCTIDVNSSEMLLLNSVVKVLFLSLGWEKRKLSPLL